MTRRPHSLLPQDTRGATIIEFAVVAPVVGLLLLGTFDMAHGLYMRAALQGVLQEVARSSSLEAGTEATRQAALDAEVTGQVKLLANNATVEISRRFYRTFSDASAARAEDHTDTNGNGTCDAGEPFEDANHNNIWDADGGNAGQGGAKDATMLTVHVSYPRMFPLYGAVGASPTTEVTASTILKNQPYSDQGSYDGPVTRNCPI